MDHSHHLHHHHQAIDTLANLNPFEILGFIAIFSFSFAASLHCAFMCSPLVCASMGKRAKLNQLGIWLYNFGRVSSYALAGYLLGLGGEWLQNLKPSWSSIFTKGLAIIIFAVALNKFWELLGKRSLFNINLKGLTVRVSKFFSALKSLPSWLGDFLLGFITVLLPCMTLTPALSAAAGTADPLKGLLYMCAFALGTLPMMLGATYVPLIIYRRIPENLAKWLVVIFLLLTGFITFIR